MSNNTEYQICQAIEVIANRLIQQAQFDKTIQATIVSCVDQSTGKYKIRYQDSLFYAYSNSLDSTYTQGTKVYVLIQNGDFSKPKTILGTEKGAINNNINIFEENRYDIIGNNCVGNTDYIASLCSYDTRNEQQKINIKQVLYQYENNINEINFSQINFERYIKEGEIFGLGGTFSTYLPDEQQTKGNYGISCVLSFKSADGIEENRNKFVYIVDVNNMLGTPYNCKNSEQIAYFSIDPEKYIRVEEISFFAKDFEGYPKPETYTEDTKDLFVTNLKLVAAKTFQEQELNQTYLKLETPFGKIFSDQDTLDKRINAKYISKGRDLTKTANILFYWFYKDSTVDLTSPKYSKYGGCGWACLNDFRKAGVDETTTAIEYIGKTENYLIVKQEDILSQRKVFKCVAVENNSLILQREITFERLNSLYKINLSSSNGTVFYRDSGNTTIQADVQIPSESKNLSYYWSKTDIFNRFDIIAANGQNNIEVYAKDIFKQMDYSCTVYNEDLFIGTETITIYNRGDLEDNPAYELYILNGNQVFQYDENGVSPTNELLEHPQQILPLSFYIYDNIEGKKIDPDAIPAYNIKWTVPSQKNSLINIIDQKDTDNIQEDYNTYTGNKELYYTLYPEYNYNKNRNTINLEVEYNDVKLLAQTNFSFLKVGDNGSNGTSYVCRISPSINTNENVYFPCLIVNKNQGEAKWNFTPKDNNYPFKAELWENGINIFNDVSSNDTVKVEWSILKNKIRYDKYDISNFIIDKDQGQIEYNELDNTLSNGKPIYPVSNILKVTITYQRRAFYATLPIGIIEVNDDSYSYSLADNSGFKYVIYKADGTSPSYARNNPFKINVTRDNELIDGLIYNWKAIGYHYVLNDKTYVLQSSEQLKINNYTQEAQSLLPNECRYAATSQYDGMCLSNAVCCEIKANIYNEETGQNEEKILANITLPIHFYLQRYSNSAINMWDGNSISINDDAGVILSPQMGAGIKNAKNQFTGLIMGAAKVETDSQAYDKVGLMGYSEGEETIFLNAEDGQATFGKKGSGQIIFSPKTATNEEQAIIKQGNYSETLKTGMQINLTKPEIRFGQNNFVVDSNGKLSCQGANLSGNLYASNSNYQLIFNESSALIAYGDGSRQGRIDFRNALLYFKNDNGIVSITQNGIRIGSETDSDGSLTYSKNTGLIIKGSITATSGFIGGWKLGVGPREDLEAGETLSYLSAGNLALWSDGKIENGINEVEEDDKETTSIILKKKTTGSTLDGQDKTNYLERIKIKGSAIEFSHRVITDSNVNVKNPTYTTTAEILTNNHPFFKQSLYFRAGENQDILFGGILVKGAEGGEQTKKGYVWGGLTQSYPKEYLYDTVDKDLSTCFVMGDLHPNLSKSDSYNAIITRSKIFIKDIQLTHKDFRDKTLTEFLKETGKLLPIREEDYNALQTKDKNTFYLIIDEE